MIREVTLCVICGFWFLNRGASVTRCLSAASTGLPCVTTAPHRFRRFGMRVLRASM
jgi:hypothetical protein